MAAPIENPIDGPNGRALWARADRVLPGGGIYLSRSADMARRGVLPGFIVEAQGCRVTDADGRSYVDFLCANGPNLLGYRHPEVEEAAQQQARRMTSASLFPSALVEVVERLVDRFDDMNWGLVSKNGSEVVALAVRIARQHTQRRRIVAFRQAYHGNDPEFASSPPAGVLTEGTAEILRCPWNDSGALEDIARKYQGEIAAVLLNPNEQIPLVPTTPATPEFLEQIRKLQAEGVVLVIDDVRHGFRMHPLGSHRALGLQPDLITLGKALGNGYSISALLGGESVRKAARKILYTSTYMFETPPMHAAMACMQVYDRDQVFEHMQAMGARLRTGLLNAASAAGHKVDITGPLAMPTLLFEGDHDLARGRRFAHEAARLGVIFHPVLNWFLSGAHSASDIDLAISVAEQAFRLTPVSAPG